LKNLLPFFLLFTAIILDYTSIERNHSPEDRVDSNLEVSVKNTAELIEPDLLGPSLLCNVSGTVVGSFNGSGDPITDLYSWRIYGPSGAVLFSKPPGAFQNINYTFITNGIHRIELDVSRGGIKIANFDKLVEVVQGPQITLSNEYIICSTQPLEIRAIDPSSSNFSNYQFEWKNEEGTIVSTSNTLTTSEDGVFSVVFFIENSLGERTCEFSRTTNISNISTISIESSGTGVCVDGEISFQTNPQLVGEWFIQKKGDPTIQSFGKSNSLTIRPGSDLIDFGDYEVSFLLENPSNPTCSPEGKIDFRFDPEPIFVYEAAETSSGCLQADGKLIIRALTDLDFINIEGTGLSYGPFAADDLIEIPNLKSGTYNLIGGLGPCINSIGSVVPLANPPAALDFEIGDIVGEACTANGKIPGSFQVTLLNGPTTKALYRVINEKGGVALNQALPNAAVFRVEIPGGNYFFEIYDEDEECILPSRTDLVIPGKDQTNYQIPETLNICQSYELTPLTSQPLIFTITRPDQTTESKNAGEPIFLDQKGEYRIVGTLPDQAEVCPTERTVLVDLIDPVDFEINLVAEDCEVGNRSYEANIFSRDPNTVLFFWRNELNEIIGTSQRLDLPPTSFGDYSLEVQPSNSEACPIAPKPFLAKEPILSVDLTLVSTKLCEFGPKAIIDLTTTFPDEVTNVGWRRFDAAGNIEILGPFDNPYQIEVDIEGTYEASVFSRIPSLSKNCELGRSNIQVDLIPQKVDFNIPTELSICNPYELIPQSSDPLTYTLTYPDGDIQTKEWNEAFLISQPGTYTLLGYNSDATFPLCPEQKQFEVTLNEPVQFSPKLDIISCEGVYEYSADISNYPVSKVDIFWRDQSGNLIGSDQTLLLSSYGTFTLEVQPKGSIPCQIQPISFDAPVPVLSLEVEILAETLCPDQPDASLTANVDLSQISNIEWWFTDINNNQSRLPTEPNQVEILATSEGTYEVQLFNQFGCLLGQDQVLVLRSSDQIRPIVEESYQICPRYEIGPQIIPGNFASYEWYFQDNLVSSSPTFKPNQIGTYNLIVYSSEGCAYEASFNTVEECELRVAFPNAIQPGNPDKPFLIYTNYLIDELEIWIFSKWGEVIFHCSKTELLSEESTCLWDGYLDGQRLPPGSYAYRMNYRNNEKNISKEQLGSILIID
jgi:hypothetical protein